MVWSRAFPPSFVAPTRQSGPSGASSQCAGRRQVTPHRPRRGCFPSRALDTPGAVPPGGGGWRVESLGPRSGPAHRSSTGSLWLLSLSLSSCLGHHVIPGGRVYGVNEANCVGVKVVTATCRWINNLPQTRTRLTDKVPHPHIPSINQPGIPPFPRWIVGHNAAFVSPVN